MGDTNERNNRPLETQRVTHRKWKRSVTKSSTKNLTRIRKNACLIHLETQRMESERLSETSESCRLVFTVQATWRDQSFGRAAPRTPSRAKRAKTTEKWLRNRTRSLIDVCVGNRQDFEKRPRRSFVRQSTRQWRAPRTRYQGSAKSKEGQAEENIFKNERGLHRRTVSKTQKR